MIQSGLKHLGTLPAASCEEQKQAAARGSRARKSKMLLRANMKNRHSPCRKTLDSKTTNINKTSCIDDTAAISLEVDKMDMQTARESQQYASVDIVECDDMYLFEIDQLYQDHSIISTPESSDTSTSGSPAGSDLISLQGRSDFLDEMWANPQGYDPLIDMKYDPVMTDWQLLRQQYTLQNDINLAKSPSTRSYSDSEPLQNRHNSILSLDSHMDLVCGLSPAKSQGNPKEKKHKSTPLACPFYRGNPWKYYTCQKYDLQRIKDVKQHINRKHVKPDFYCARCYEVFVNATSRDAHAREGTCDIRSYPQFDGITDSQRGELKECHKRGREIAEQWYYIWDILFRGQPRPKSPYIGNYREEMGPLIKDFWNSKRLEIISNIPPRLSQGMFDQVMDIVLNHYESESANTTTSTELRQKNCTQTPYEVLDSADTAIAAPIAASNAAQHVGMVNFNCSPADFNSVRNAAAIDSVRCLPGSDLEVQLGFGNLNQEYRYIDRVY